MTQLATLSTTISAESTAFLRGIEDCRGGLKRLIASLDPAAAATARYNASMTVLSNGLKAGKIDQEQYALAVSRLTSQLEATRGAQSGVAASTGQVRAGMQQLAFNVNDVATGFATGQKPMMIFAQQGGQIIQSIQLMSGEAKGFLGVLAGPWGLALTSAATVAVPFIMHLWESTDAAQAAKAKIDALTASIDKLKKAQGGLGDVGNAETRIGQLQSERLTLRLNAPGDSIPGAQARSRAKDIDKEIEGLQALIRWQKVSDDSDAQKKAADQAARDAKRDANKEASAAARLARQAAEAAERLTEQYQSQLASLQRQMQVNEALADGQRFSADLIQSTGQLREQFKDIDAKRLQILLDQNQALLFQEAHYREMQDAAKEAASISPIVSVDKSALEASLKQISGWNEMYAKKSKDSWADSAHSIIRSFDDVARGLQGNFLQALDGVLGIFEQLGKLGLFGGTIQSNLAGARASGGPVSAGSTYLVGERGPELFTPGSSGHIVANDNIGGLMDGGQRMIRVVVDTSPLLQVQMAETAQAVSAPMVQRGIGASVGLAETRSAQRSRQILPSRRR